jgi:rRNA small subunit pseudouridine methyltransferase Nep1
VREVHGRLGEKSDDCSRVFLGGSARFHGARQSWKDLIILLVTGYALLNFILAESALELVPREIRKFPAVVSDSKRRQAESSKILLDRSFHHSAMVRLKDSEKRGRPDLVHVTLLSVTGTPLYLDGMARIFVHTYDDAVIEIAEKTRIPKSYLRFRGLMEEALVERPRKGLIVVHSMSVRELAKNVSADAVFGLSVQGKQMAIEELARRISAARDPCVVVGGFPRGHFSQDTLSALNQLVRIHPRPLEAHVVASRVIYEVEKVRYG